MDGLRKFVFVIIERMLFRFGGGDRFVLFLNVERFYFLVVLLLWVLNIVFVYLSSG